jgi:hypothetical protein
VHLLHAMAHRANNFNGGVYKVAVGTGSGQLSQVSRRAGLSTGDTEVEGRSRLGGMGMIDRPFILRVVLCVGAGYKFDQIKHSNEWGMLHHGDSPIF